MRTLREKLIYLLDQFSLKLDVYYKIVLIGGEAVIMHGVPRVTIDTDFLLLFFDKKQNYLRPVFYTDRCVAVTSTAAA